MGAGRKDQPGLTTPLRNAARRPQRHYTFVTVISVAKELGAEGSRPA
jgi:hypothetical protein